MTRYILITFLILGVIKSGYGQKVKSPKDITEALALAVNSVNDSVIENSKTFTEQEFVRNCENWNSIFGDFIFNWLYTNDKQSKIEKFYAKQGVRYTDNIKQIISISLYRYILNIPLEHDQLVDEYAAIELKWAEEDEVRSTADSLRGKYIPINLADCFKQIDSFWTDSTKNEIKGWTEDQFSGSAHMGFGLWMRNNWQLWRGSRLSAYFNNLGIYHPDDMSGIILISYHRYLNKKEIELEEQIKFYQDYWKKANEENEQNKK